MKIIQTKMQFRAVEMTPEYAQELLDKNHPQNRKFKSFRITQYERDINSGIWLLTHQAIAVDEDGWLVDGQNRLTAIIRSGKSVPVVFVTGVHRDSILGVDFGATRNVADAAKISGQPLPGNDKGYAAVARRMAIGLEKTRQHLTIQETLRFIKDHKEALEFAFTCMPRNVRNLTQASVRAVVARAWYKRNSRSRIREFCEVFLSGLCGNNKTDTAAIRLRNWILDTMGSRRGGNRPNAKMMYAKAEEAMKHFLEYSPIESLRETSEEHFPLATDEADDIAVDAD